MKVKSESEVSCVQLLVTPWTAAYQAPPSMGFSRQEYWNGLPLPSPLTTEPPIPEKFFKSRTFYLLTYFWFHCFSNRITMSELERGSFSPRVHFLDEETEAQRGEWIYPSLADGG